MRSMRSCCERRQAGVVAEQGLQDFVGTGGRQRVKPQLRVVGLAAPAVLVLRAVVDQEQQARRGQAFHQAVEQGLRLGINPVQVFEYQQQGLHLALPQQEPFERGESALAPLRRVERQEWAVLRQSVEQGEQRRDDVLEGLVERQHLPGGLGPHGARVVMLLDVGVALEQINHREVWRRLAVGHRGTLQHQPALRVMRAQELVDQARLAHARFADMPPPPAPGPPRPAPALDPALRSPSAAPQSASSPAQPPPASGRVGS